jgi:hypothetical protein
MCRGYKKKHTIILEAIASKDLWIWYIFFEMPISHNDINMLQRSLIFARLAEGQVHKSIIVLMAIIIQ